MTTNSLIKSGQLLVAEPFMLDPYFRRSVVLLCEHHAEGSLGFILNRKTDLTINDLLGSFPDFNAEVFYGGPVQTDTLHYVHNLGDLLEESVFLSQGVWWGGDFESLKFLISSGLVMPDNIRFFIGYAGWSGGQLEEEMEIGSWVTAHMDANYLFNFDPSKLWSKVLCDKGNRFEVIADIPEYASWN